MNLEKLSQVCVVLVTPKHPGNVGAVARVMGNMGFSDLRIVDNRGNAGLQLHRHPEAIARACDSVDILENSTTYQTLSEALHDTVHAIGTSARHREEKIPQHPRDLAPKLMERLSQGRHALVFGREDDGLTVEELSHCHELMRIPTAPVRSSLNLSHAVQIVTYEVLLAVAQPQAAGLPKPAPQEERDALFAHATQSIEALGAFPEETFVRKMRHFRAIVDRTQPTKEELYFLHGLFRQIDWVLGHWFRNTPPPTSWRERIARWREHHEK